MIERLATVCAWDPIMPTCLRALATDQDLGWSRYSTTRLAVGSDPYVVSSIVYDTPWGTECDMQLEVLPNTLATKWDEAELRLATKADFQDNDFCAVMTGALDLLATASPFLGTVAGLCRSIHLLGAATHFDSSYSDPRFPFSVFTSCPSPEENHRVERLAESILHESLHLQLSLVEAAEPLVVTSLDQPTLYSPWKKELRPVRGIMHGVYVFANLQCFWRHVASLTNSPVAATRVEEIRGQLACVPALEECSVLTPAGRRLANNLRLESRM